LGWGNMDKRSSIEPDFNDTIKLRFTELEGE
jgi:hypothetical protein